QCGLRIDDEPRYSMIWSTTMNQQTPWPSPAKTILMTMLLLTLLAACGGVPPPPNATPVPSPPTNTPVPPPPTATPAPSRPAGGANPATVVPLQERNSAHEDSGTIDAKLFQRIANIFEVFRNNADQIWADTYRLDQMPLLLVYKDAAGNPQHGYLLNHPDAASVPTAELLKTDPALKLPPVYRLTELPSARIKQVRHFDFQAPIAGVPSFIMAYNAPSVDQLSAPVSADWDAFIVHEGLHDQQDATWVQGLQSQDVDNYPLDGDAIAAIRLEHQLLIAALSAPDAATRDAAIKRFIAVRSDRIATNQLAQTMDGQQERFEGTARYIEYRLGQFIPNPNQVGAIKYLQVALEPQATRDELAFGRFYSTGAALSLLLDQVGIPWKAAVEQGQSQYEVLRDHFGLTDNAAEQAALLAEARKVYHYAALQQAGAATAKTVDAGYQRFSDDAGLDDPSSSGSDNAEIIEDVQKPYEPVAEPPITASVPAGYTLQGGFRVAYAELPHAFWQAEYSPGKKPVTIVDYAAGDQRLRITRSPFAGTLADAQTIKAETGLFAGGERRRFGARDVLLFTMEDATTGPYTAIGFVHDGHWYTAAGDLSVEPMAAIAAEMTTQ
ncbi:MAG: hypothetical protein MI924_39095, partial [Chloroflexales bacterium]|nr:hypothetical protein [Chloroflexales bacterium]